MWSLRFTRITQASSLLRTTPYLFIQFAVRRGGTLVFVGLPLLLLPLSTDCLRYSALALVASLDNKHPMFRVRAQVKLAPLLGRTPLGQ
jgi:hypothetical protein